MEFLQEHDNGFAVHIRCKPILLALATGLLFSHAGLAQDTLKARAFYLGGTLGISSYTTTQKEIPVSPKNGLGAEVGFAALFPWQNGGFVKVGVEYTYYRSAFENDTSYYDGYLQIPVIFRIADLATLSHNSRLVLSLGPRFSLLAEQGRAGTGDQNYEMDKSAFGGVYKTGIVSEIAVYCGPNNNRIHSFGLRFSSDISGWSARLGSENLVINDHYLNGTLFYNINFQ
jgi:hypothetical protein